MKKIPEKIIMILAAALLSAAQLSGCKSAKVPHVILDTDMGHMNDDMLTLSLLLKAEEAGKIKLDGITLEGGNNFIEASYENYGELQKSETELLDEFLPLAGRTDLPVKKGTDFPDGFGPGDEGKLAGFFAALDYVPEGDEYGAVHFFTNRTAGDLVDADDAADFLLEEAKKYPRQVVIFAIGPTMNLARAIEKDPAFAGKIRTVYYMGGAFTGEGNITPYAEYNVCYDAASFLTCLTAGFPEQVISPAEICEGIDEGIVERLSASIKKNDPIGTAWIRYYHEFLQDWPYWDPVTAIAFLAPKSAETRECYVTVNTDRTDPRYAETIALSGEDYESLSASEKEKYGRAHIITGCKNFWDIAAGYL